MPVRSLDPATRWKVIVILLVVGLACLLGFNWNENLAPTNGQNSRTTKPQAYDDAAAAMNRGDYSTAMRIGRPLAEAGDARAQEIVGILYFQGSGVPQDYAEAVKWFRRAADQGKVSAQQWMGTMYRDGTGVPLDYVRAYKWFTLSIQNSKRTEADAELGSVVRAALAQSMTPAQIAGAQRLADEWRPGGSVPWPPQIEDRSTADARNKPAVARSADAYAGMVDRVIIASLGQRRDIVRSGCGVLASSADLTRCSQALRLAETQVRQVQTFMSKFSAPECVLGIHARLREALKSVAQAYTAAENGISTRNMTLYRSGSQAVEAVDEALIEQNVRLRAALASGICLPQ